MQRNHSRYIAPGLLLLFLGMFYYWHSIGLFPTFIHGWTQSDRYALALSYLNNGLHLLTPQTYNLMTVNGITGVDLPWHEYLIALIMRVSGIDEPWVFRLYTLMFCSLGYIYLYRLSLLFSNSPLRSLIIVAFTFSLPVLTYYQAGFVPSAPALAVTLMGLYYYFRYRINNSFLYFVVAILCITAAALLRSPFNIVLFAILLLQGYSAYKKRMINWNESVLLAIAYGLIMSWQVYKSYLNSQFGSMFLTEIMPANHWSHFWNLCLEVINRWQWEYFTLGHYLILGLACISLLLYLISKKGCSQPLTLLSQLTALLLAGGFCFFLLMTKQFPAHDYYMIDSFYPGVILFTLLGFSTLPKSPFISKWLLNFALIFGVSLAVYASHKVQQQRYTVNFWDRGYTTWQNFKDSKKLLDDLNIDANATILVLDAYSTNAPLILMDRRGYTVQHTTRQNLKKALDYPFDYIVIQDIFLPSDVLYNYPELSQHLIRLGGNGKVSVYAYTTRVLNQTIADNLGVPENKDVYVLDFTVSNPKPWEWSLDTARADDGNLYGHLSGDQLFGPVMILHETPSRDKMLFQAEFRHIPSETRFEVIASAMHDSKQIYYASFPVHLQKPGSWIKYRCLFDIPEGLPEDVELKCNIYNPNGAAVDMQQVKVWLY